MYMEDWKETPTPIIVIIIIIIIIIIIPSRTYYTIFTLHLLGYRNGPLIKQTTN